MTRDNSEVDCGELPQAKQTAYTGIFRMSTAPLILLIIIIIIIIIVRIINDVSRMK